MFLELVTGILGKADFNVNMTESLLKLQGSIPEIEGGVSPIYVGIIYMFNFDSLDYTVRRTEEPFQELNKKSVGLRRILSRIPDEIDDRRTFLETIK